MRQIIKTVKFLTILFGILNVFSLTSCKDEIGEVTVPVTGVALNLSELKIQEGVEYKLTCSITPENATNKQIEWEVSELSVEGCVEVDSKTGLIKPMKPGTAVITVKTLDGNFTASCGIEVVEEFIPIKSIVIPKVQSIIKGEKFTFTPVITPEAPSNNKLNWSLENVTPSGCLTIDETTGEITAVKEGTATVNVVAADGWGAKASCQVTVLSDEVAPTDISIKPSTLDMEIGGEPFTLIAEILPAEATNKEIIWEVVNSDPSGCVTVDDKGVVTATAKGTATVKATVKDTELFAECVVTVLGAAPAEGYEVVNGVWLIYNKQGLSAFKAEVNTNPAVAAKLVKDIDLGAETWEPIGSKDKPYSGTFDGNGKKISNLNIVVEGETHKGFFGKLQAATITNLGIESGKVDGLNSIGGIVGEAVNSNIINCYNKAYASGYEKFAGVGGIVGRCTDSNIIACYNEGELGKSAFGKGGYPTSGAVNIGGIAGEVTGASNIIACYNRGAITNERGPSQGGIAGVLETTTSLYGVYNVGPTSKPTKAWAISGGSSVSFIMDGVYWVTDIDGSTANFGNNVTNDESIGIISSEMNSQTVINAMNEAIQSSGVEIAKEYEFKAGTGNYQFPVIIKK